MSYETEIYAIPSMELSRDRIYQPLAFDDFISEPTNSSKPYYHSIKFQSDSLEEIDYSVHDSIVPSNIQNFPAYNQTTGPDSIGPVYQPLYTNEVHDVNVDYNELSAVHHSNGVPYPTLNYRKSSSQTKNSSQSFPCQICGKFLLDNHKFGFESKFFSHLKTHINIICPLCNVSFRMPDLNQHINIHANKDSITQCPICFIKTKRMCRHLKSHVQSIKCPIPTCALHIHFSDFKCHASQHSEQIFPKRVKVSTNKTSKRRKRLNRTRYFDTTQVNCVNHLAINYIKQTGMPMELTDSNIPHSGSAVPSMVPSKKLKHSFSCPAEKNDVGFWEKHTKGIGMKLMNKMGYVPGQGLGLRGDGLLEPVEAVLLPKKVSLDTAFRLGKSDTVNDDKKTTQLQDTAKQLEARILDRSLAAKREELRNLIDTIEVNSNYLRIIQNKIEARRLDILPNSPKEAIKIDLSEVDLSEKEMFEISQLKLHYSASGDYVDIVVISSDDEI